MTRKYLLEAFEVGKEKAIMRRDYTTSIGLARGTRVAMERDADFVIIRRIKND